MKDAEQLVTDLQLPEMDPRYKAVDGWNAFRWPEFIAFAQRLGIDLSKPIKSVAVKMSLDEAVGVTIDYLGTDLGPILGIETTTVHNKKFRTFMPSAVHAEKYKEDEEYRKRCDEESTKRKQGREFI